MIGNVKDIADGNFAIGKKRISKNRNRFSTTAFDAFPLCSKSARFRAAMFATPLGIQDAFFQ
jgi:hypothetical protein